MIEVTERQKETLDFIEGFVKEKGYAPSFREIANGIGVTVGAIQKLLEKLQRKGVIKKASGLSRGIRVLRKENSIPIFAFVKAGSPGIADEEPVDYLTIEGTLGVKAGDRGHAGKRGQHDRRGHHTRFDRILPKSGLHKRECHCDCPGWRRSCRETIHEIRWEDRPEI